MVRRQNKSDFGSVHTIDFSLNGNIPHAPNAHELLLLTTSRRHKSPSLVLYDSDNVTIDFLKNYEGLESIRISYFKDGHWVGESWVDNVLSQDNAGFRKDF